MVGRFKRVLWWGVHATTVLLVLLMVFSYMPNSWIGKYKYETRKLKEKVSAQYIVWSGRAELKVIISDYDAERVHAAQQWVHAMNAQGNNIHMNFRRNPHTMLGLRPAVRMRRAYRPFAMPLFRYQPKTRDSYDGEFFISLPISYPILGSVACSGSLVWLRRRRIPEGCCQSCGYALDGLTTSTCPECGITIVTIG